MNISVYIDNLYKKLKVNKDMDNFFKENNTINIKKQIENNVGNFFLFLNQSKCNQCKKLSLCKNKINGFILKPYMENNTKKIKFKFKKCIKNKELDRKAQNSSIFDICQYTNYSRTISDVRAEIIKNLSDTNQKNTLSFAKLLSSKFLDNQDKIRSFFIYSKNSSYKSFLIEAFCNELSLRKTKIRISFLKILVLINTLKSYIGKGNSSEFQFNLIEKACNSDILIIDDLGKEKFSPWIHMEILYLIFERRTSNSKTIIFVSCLNIESLRNHYLNNINNSQVNSFINIIKQNIVPKTLKKPRIVCL